MANVVPRSPSDHRPSTSPVISQSFNAHSDAQISASTRPTHSFSRPNLPRINIDTHKIQQPSPRRASRNLALQARDSVAVRKRTMSTGAMSARLARHQARRANAEFQQSMSKAEDHWPSGRARSRSPAATPPTRRDSHPGHRSPSPSPTSSSPSQSSTPITPSQPNISGAPSSFHSRAHTHAPHNSQGTATSAYPPSSSQSSRSPSPHSPFPEQSRTPSPKLQNSAPDSTPHTPSLDLDPDDVNARLRLLVNNSYFLPPAHTKPELTPIYLTPTSMRGASSPSAFMEFFRVGKKKEKKVAEMHGYTGPGVRHGAPFSAPHPASGGMDERPGTFGHGQEYFVQPPVSSTQSRVVVVRETVDDLPPPVFRPPLRSSSLPSHYQRVAATAFIDPTTQYDMPPPSHYPSYKELRIDGAGITGDVELDQFAPPGSPWSPSPFPRGTRNGPNGSMDPQELVWRRAILEQAVDLSLSSAASDPGHTSPGFQDISFTRGLGRSTEDIGDPLSPRTPRSKKSWWGRKDSNTDEAIRRPSTSPSIKERDIFRKSTSDRATHSLDSHVHPPVSPQHLKPSLGQPILPNMHAELEELERQQAEIEAQTQQRIAQASRSLRLKPLAPFVGSSLSAPTTPLYQDEIPPSTLPMTPLRPPAYRKGQTRPLPSAMANKIAREFMPGHSTIRKSLSSPLLSDLHEMGVEVEEPLPFANDSNESLDGVAAPSLVLQDPHGVTSLVHSNTASSFTSGSHYSEDEDDAIPHDEQQYRFPPDDPDTVDPWSRSLSSPPQDEARPSFDSFGIDRVRSPESDCPARASSTFGFRRSNVSMINSSPLRGQDIEVDISGDPMEHLSMMSTRSISPSAQSQMSSVRGYSSALDRSYHESEHPSMRPSSPMSRSFHSTETRYTSINSQPLRPESPVEIESLAPISFFDSVQHQSYMNADDGSSDSDADIDEPPDEPTFHPEKPLHTETLGRNSLNMARPAPAFATQFRNASQPQLPLARGSNRPSLESLYRPIQPYELLDRKKPLTNTPVSSLSTSAGILSQLKSRPSKPTLPFSNKGKKKPASSPTVMAQSTFELLRYPPGSAFSLGSGAGASMGSEVASIKTGAGSSRFDNVKAQGSVLSLRSSAAASVQHVNSWRQEQSGQDESLRKLDGMVVQHLEAEKDRLRKIAAAAREKGGERVRS